MSMRVNVSTFDNEAHLIADTLRLYSSAFCVADTSQCGKNNHS